MNSFLYRHAMGGFAALSARVGCVLAGCSGRADTPLNCYEVRIVRSSENSTWARRQVYVRLKVGLTQSTLISIRKHRLRCHS
jgi:hypothetical protein